MRPTPAGVEVARALIARVKAADSIIKRADELLVCAAVASRSGEFGGVPAVCARAMGKTISKPKRVNEWIARLEKLEQALATETGSWLEPEIPMPQHLISTTIFRSSRVKFPGKFLECLLYFCNHKSCAAMASQFCKLRSAHILTHTF